MKRFISLSVLALSVVANADNTPRPLGLPAPRPAGIVVPRPIGLPVPPRPVGIVVPRPIGLPVHPPTVGIVVPNTPNYSDIVRVTVGYGATNTMFNPNEVLRPYRGDLLRVTVPSHCGISMVQVAAWGRTLNGGQRIQLPLAHIGTRPDVNATRFIYQVNGGQAATVREVGLALTSFANSCEITFEQANRNDFNGGNNECNSLKMIACAAYVDNTRYCEARSSFASYVEDANVGSDNSCYVTQRLKQQICRNGQLPSQFQISCR